MEQQPLGPDRGVTADADRLAAAVFIVPGPRAAAGATSSATDVAKRCEKPHGVGEKRFEVHGLSARTN
jgi:hypothetical protein